MCNGTHKADNVRTITPLWKNTYTRQPRSTPSLKRSVSFAPLLVMASLIACSSFFALNRNLILPVQLVGHRDFFFLDCCHSLTYVSIHSSTVISRRPSMIAINPPVLVPRSDQTLHMAWLVGDPLVHGSIDPWELLKCTVLRALALHHPEIADTVPCYQEDSALRHACWIRSDPPCDWQLVVYFIGETSKKSDIWWQPP